MFFFYASLVANNYVKEKKRYKTLTLLFFPPQPPNGTLNYRKVVGGKLITKVGNNCSKIV